MLKKMIAWVLVLALTISVMPQLSLGVSAEGEKAIPAPHSHSAEQHDCEHCDETITWTAWEETDSLPNVTGHYYLTDDVKVTARTTYDSTDNVVICLNGYNVDGSAKDLPFYLQDTAKLTISDCTAYTDAEGNFHAGKLTGGKATGSMPTMVFAKGSSQYALYNCIVTGNVHVNNSNTAANYGGAVHVRDKSTAHLENVLFENNTSGRDGGVVNVNGANASMTIENCIFRKNTAATGGAVYVYKGNVTITDSVFEENTATDASGGNIRLNAATVSMDNCTMTGNIGKNSGGSAIHAGGGNCLVTLNDCVITGNVSTGTSNTYRGAVYMTNASDKLVVSGATVIDNNHIATDDTPIERNIFIQNPVNPVDVGGLTKGASISIHTRNSTATDANMVKAENAPAEWNRNWVVYENTGKAIEYGSAEGFYFADIIGHTHCLCGASSCTDATHTKIDFQEWEYTDSLPASGNYYLKADVVLSGEAVISENLNLCLNGCTVTQTKNGERVIGVTSGKVCITGCNGGTITGGNATSNSGGGIDVNGEKAELSLNNITVTGNNASSNGGGIAVRGGGKLTAIGAKITNNESAKDGAGIYCQAGTEVTVKDTEFTSNRVTNGAGGGVAISGKGTLNNVTIKKNTSSGGGAGLIVQGSGDVTVNGGVISENEAGSTGGGIYALKKLTLNGTTVTGNKADKLAGGIYLATDKVLTITGETVVKDNAVTNLYLKSNCYVILEKLSGNAHIGVSVLDNAPRAITGQTEEDPSAYVFSDSSNLQPVYREKVVYLDETIKHKHCLCGSDSAGCDHADVKFAMWEKTDSLPTTGAYYLENDVVLNGEVSITGNLTLCLNGHKITQTKAANRVLKVSEGGSLTIASCAAGGTITGGNTTSNGGAGIYATGEGTTLKLYNITVSGNNSSSNGGGIHLGSKSQGVLSNVTISGNTAGTNGGGIAVRENAKLTMIGGAATDNESSRDGAGIYVQAGCEATITDTLVTGNACATSGGGVSISGKAVLNNLTVQKNTAGSGAGLMIQGSAVVTMNGGIVSENEARSNGGGIYALKQLTLNGTKITNNSAKSAGSGIYVAADNVLTVTGTTVVKDNTAQNVYLKGTYNMIFGQLSEGAEIYISNDDPNGRAISGTTEQDPSAYLRSDDPELRVAYRDKIVYLEINSDHIHCLCGGAGTGCDHSNLTYKKWTDASSLPTSGNYYLDTDVTLTGEISVKSDLNLCLNGHTVTAAENKRFMSNPKNTVVTIAISDCTATTDADGVYTAGKLTGGADMSTNTGGGAFYIRTGGTLKIYDGIISNCTSITQGGAICLADTTKMEMHGGEISGCKAVSADGSSWKKGGAIISYNAELTITGGTICNNQATNGAISGNSKSTITITGGTICDNWSKSDGAGVYVNGSGLYISGTAKICNNESNTSGGNICYGGNSYGSVADVTIEGGKAASGAGVIVQNNAVVDFTNVTFKNNEANNVAGAIRLYKATLTMTDCIVTGNTAKTATGISVENEATLTIKNGKISDNTATDSVGGIRLDAAANLILEGAPVIIGNAGGNLVLRSGAVMDAGAVTEGTDISVTAELGVISKPCADVSKYFKSDSAYRMVVYRDGALHMVTDGSHKHCFCADSAAGCDHSTVEWAAWESTTTLPTSGNYYLLNDVQMSDAISVSAELNLCLNGHTVTAAEGKRHIASVKDKDVHIVICDCTAKTVDDVYTAGKLTGGLDKSDNTGGGSIYLRAGAKLELFDGIITGNRSTLAGGGVTLNSGSSFIMHGGEISNNKCLAEDDKTWKNGGGIYANKDTEIQILGGTVKNNEGNLGGGISFYGTGKLTIAGGEISENVGHGQGGGIYAKSTTVTISGGKICGNKTTVSAGGLCLGTGAVATMTGGEISGNEAPIGGGVIAQGSSTLEFSGGKILNNAATTSYGAGVALFSKAKLVMTGGEISGNTSVKNGAGVYCTKAFVDMQGGAITGNTSGKDGGGIYVNATGNVDISGQALISGNAVTNGSGGGISYGSTSTGKISGGTIEKNKAGGGGALMIQNGAEVEISAGNIQNNTATAGIGGGVRVYKATLNITGGNFQNNEAAKSGGGGLAAATKSTVTISGGTFQGNKALNGSGGGISVYSETVFTMTGGTVKNNYAKTTGGGIASSKCTSNISGVTVTGNSCLRDGAGIYNTAGVMNIKGGVVAAYNTTKGNGGGICYGSKSSGYISGASVYENSVEGGGGAMIIQNNAMVTIGYITVTDNTAQKTGGGIYVYKAGVAMNGGKIAGNVSVKSSGGGIYAVDATKLELSNMLISKNTAKSGAGVYALRSKVFVKDSEISENVSEGSGTGIYVSGGTWKAALAGGELTNVKLIGNHGGRSNSGAAVYMNVDVEVTFTNCEIANNISDNYCGGIYAAAGAVPTLTNCSVTGNQAVVNGGAMLVRDCGVLTNCYFANNKADKGGAIFGGNHIEQWSVNGWGSKGDDIGLFMTDCTFENNTAVTDGGAFHLDMSCYTTIDRCTFTGNSAGVQGGAMWLWENCTMTNLTVTGNKCGENGYALYLADSEHDGQTYINGLFKMGGNMIVKDNEGGDLYLANKVTIGALKEGYGENTHMGVTLDAGLLTQRVMGEYNYEGGNLEYVLTYGSRSMTDPEYLEPTVEETEPVTDGTQSTNATVSNENASTEDNTALYVGIGGIAAIIVLAAAVLVIVKKKKAGKATGAEKK